MSEQKEWKCPVCIGRGIRGFFKKRTCSTCNGIGRISMAQAQKLISQHPGRWIIEPIDNIGVGSTDADGGRV
jgi:hypothetical protein